MNDTETFLSVVIVAICLICMGITYFMKRLIVEVKQTQNQIEELRRYLRQLEISIDYMDDKIDGHEE